MAISGGSKSYLPEDNFSYPVYIEIDSKYSGSGFLLRNADESQVYLVTARHVIFKKVSDSSYGLLGRKAKLVLHNDPRSADNKGKVTELELNLTKLFYNKKLIFHLNKDVAICSMGTMNNFKKYDWNDGIRHIGDTNCSLVAVKETSFKKFDEALISNEVFIFGYPSSLALTGLNQICYSEPLLRKGIIAGKNTLNKTIILDCPVYHGNSGGLVLEVDYIYGDSDALIRQKLLPIGLVSEYVPSPKMKNNVLYDYENSGYSVVTPIDSILELISVGNL